MPSTAATQQRLAAMFGHADTPILAASAMMLDASTDLTADQVLARHWITTELLRRHPEAKPAMDAWADTLTDDPNEPSYVEALLAALPETALGL